MAPATMSSLMPTNAWLSFSSWPVGVAAADELVEVDECVLVVLGVLEVVDDQVLVDDGVDEVVLVLVVLVLVLVECVVDDFFVLVVEVVSGCHKLVVGGCHQEVVGFGFSVVLWVVGAGSSSPSSVKCQEA